MAVREQDWRAKPPRQGPQGKARGQGSRARLVGKHRWGEGGGRGNAVILDDGWIEWIELQFRARIEAGELLVTLQESGEGVTSQRQTTTTNQQQSRDVRQPGH